MKDAETHCAAVGCAEEAKSDPDWSRIPLVQQSDFWAMSLRLQLGASNYIT